MLLLFQVDAGEGGHLWPISERTASVLEKELLGIASPSQLTDAAHRDPLFSLYLAIQKSARSLPGDTLSEVLDSWKLNLSMELCHGRPMPDAANESTCSVTPYIRLDHRRAAQYLAVAELFYEQSSAGSSRYPDWSLAERHARSLLRLLPKQEGEAPLLLRQGAARIVPLENARQLTPPLLEEHADLDIRLAALANRLAKADATVGAFESRLQNEKMQALKELAYGASHEINNPLANIAARAQTLLREEDGSTSRSKKLRAIQRQAMRAHEMIADLMLFACPPEPNFAIGDVVELCDQTIRHISEQAESERISILLFAPKKLRATFDKVQLQAALLAVLQNAVQASGPGDQIEVTIDGPELSAALFEISIRDHGEGLSPRAAQHLFDPFFCGREAGRGLGFGLTKAWRITSAHGGDIVAGNHPHGGAEIRISMPLTPGSAVGDPRGLAHEGQETNPNPTSGSSGPRTDAAA